MINLAVIVVFDYRQFNKLSKHLNLKRIFGKQEQRIFKASFSKSDAIKISKAIDIEI